jgi:tRNA (guanine37-N1)-methyltransferase
VHDLIIEVTTNFQTMIDKSLFDKSEFIRAVRLPAKSVGSILKSKKYSADPVNMRILLLQDVFPTELIVEYSASETDYQLKWTYEDFNTEEVLKVLLPDVSDPPTSFEKIGHIAHMNLRDEYLPYKQIIGQVIIDKNAHIDVVVTKVGSLQGEFRTFDMEIIGSRNGAKSLVATVSENKMKLLIDFQKCYWNSRLSTERQRLLSKFKSTPPEESRFIDMCCGVGALACFAAREGMEVFANDLNPDAVSCVIKNAESNRVHLETFNMDAREFVKTLVTSGKLSSNRTNHVMINLPEIAIEFLDVFVGLFDSDDSLGDKEFRIYCHCFSRQFPPDTDIKGRVYKALSLNGESSFDMDIVHIRDVAPNKLMYSVEFTVPRNILVSNKRIRLD